MRRLLLLALFAGRPAYAAVKTASAAPIAKVAAVKARADLSTGEAFLQDKGAKAWVLANRPDAAAVFEAAYRSHDLAEMLAEPESPQAVRAALLARLDDPIAAQPARLMAIVRADPEMAAQTAVYAEAVLEWDALPPQARSLLSRAQAAAWPGMTLAERYASVNDAVVALWNGQPPAADIKEHAARYKAFVETWGWLAAPMEQERQNSQMAVNDSLVDGTARVAAALRRAGRDPAADPLFRAIEDAPDPERSLTQMAAALRALGLEGKTQAGADRLGLKPGEVTKLAAALSAAFRAELASDPAGRELLAFSDAAGIVTKIKLGPSIWGANANLRGRAIELTEPELAGRIRLSGRTAREISSDPEALRLLAAFYAPLIVHELTHHKQAAEHPAFAFKQTRLEWEFEAFTAEAAFKKRKLASDPTYAARLKKIGGDEFATPEEMLDGLAMWDWLKSGPYSGFPTLRLAIARQLSGLEPAVANVTPSHLSAIERELARRRRMPGGMRQTLERQPNTGPGPANGKPTSYLRLLRDQVGRATETTVRSAEAAVRGFAANVEASYRSLK